MATDRGVKMPRMSKQRRLEWSFFLDRRNRISYNPLCRGCIHGCKPLIVTTNLSLDELQHPQDTPHARIYDRLLEMCAPILFTGTNFRRQTAQNKLDKLKALMGSPQSRKTLWERRSKEARAVFAVRRKRNKADFVTTR